MCLRGCRDAALDCQRCQEELDLDGPQRRRMTVAVKRDEASNPIGVRLLRANAVVLEAYLLLRASSSRLNGGDGAAVMRVGTLFVARTLDFSAITLDWESVERTRDALFPVA